VIVATVSSSPDPRTLLKECLVWDNHTCLPLRPDDDAFLPQLERARLTGVTVVSVNIGFGDCTVERHFKMLAMLRHWIGERSGEYLLVHTVGDVDRARREGKLGVCFDIEGAGALGNQSNLIALYYQLGVRWMLLSYNQNSACGGGCHDDDQGLTAFGREVVMEMARVGMVTCASHAGPATARDIIDASPNPVIFSHSNARALHDHPRNISDEVIRACAARGGVVCINGIGAFLGDPEAKPASVARHIDHVAQLVGSQHVGLGLDYVYDRQELNDYLSSMELTFPRQAGYDGDFRMMPPEGLVDVVRDLQGRGYSREALEDILGRNLLRIARCVWK
jgi:membrane dipeptidase